MALTGRKAGKEKMPISRAGIYSRQGLTLLELVVVLFIVSLLAAVVLPTFAGFGEAGLKAEAREMASLLRYMNDSALSRKETFNMKFDLDTNLVSWKGPEGEKTRTFAGMTGVTVQSKGMVSAGELIVFFQPLGIQENISVHMSRDDKSIRIILSHLSGKVTIKEEGEL
jgi:prepilin-type N-terminal cleavage/methylation domain-containing protein